jgi:hypothetical protein
MKTGYFRGIFFLFFFCMYSTSFNTVSSAAPQILMTEDAGIEPKTLGLWHWLSDAQTTRLDLIHRILCKAQFSFKSVGLRTVRFHKNLSASVNFRVVRELLPSDFIQLS